MKAVISIALLGVFASHALADTLIDDFSSGGFGFHTTQASGTIVGDETGVAVPGSIRTHYLNPGALDSSGYTDYNLGGGALFAHSSASAIPNIWLGYGDSISHGQHFISENFSASQFMRFDFLFNHVSHLYITTYLNDSTGGYSNSGAYVPQSNTPFSVWVSMNNGYIDMAHINLIQVNFGDNYAPLDFGLRRIVAWHDNATPEPTTVGVVAVGMLGFLRRARSRARRSSS